MSSRGTLATAKAYTTDETTIMSFVCSHTCKRGVVFYLYATTAGSAKIYYIDQSDNERLMSTTSVSATDLTVVSFDFPISKVKLTYEGTASGGTIEAEGRGH